MTTLNNGPSGFPNRFEGYIPDARMTPNHKAAHSKLSARNVIAGSLVGIAGISTTLVVGVGLGLGLNEPVEAGTVGTDLPQIFTEQQSTSVDEIPDALVRASTAQVATVCKIGNEIKGVQEGTGAIYRTKAGQLALGTVTHVVTYQVGGGFNEETPCWIVGSVDIGDKKLDIILEEDDFKGAFKKPTLLRAIKDQPALAVLPSDITAKLDPVIAEGLLTPLVINDKVTQKAAMIIRRQGSTGSTKDFDDANVTFMTITDAKAELLQYNTANDNNTCKGNSGSPILRIEDGQITNESFGVLSDFVKTVTEEQVCAQVGTVVGYQAGR